MRLLRFARNDNFALRTLMLVLAVLFLSTCSELEKAQDKALIKDVIISYNKMLIKAAKTGDVETLKGILAQKEREKLNLWIASWHDSNVYMDGKIKGIKFKNITISGNTANVMTSEDWIYEYRNLKTRQAVLPASGIYYEMEYILQKKKDKKWVITAMNIKTERTIHSSQPTPQ